MVILAGLGAVAAEAALRLNPGVYAGDTEQDAGFKFTLLENRKQVARFNLEGAVLECSATGDVQIDDFSSRRHRFRVDTRGNFDFDLTFPSTGLRWSVEGRFGKLDRVTGETLVRATLRVRDGRRRLDPDGAIRCTSGLVKWSARLR